MLSNSHSECMVYCTVVSASMRYVVQLSQEVCSILHSCHISVWYVVQLSQ